MDKRSISVVFAGIAVSGILTGIASVTAAPTWRIMCLGTSVTQGDYEDVEKCHRYHLVNKLHDAGYTDFDMVGPLDRPGTGWDLEHAGCSSNGTLQILNGTGCDNNRTVSDWAPQFKPNLVMIEEGVNDCRGGRAPIETLRSIEEIFAVFRKTDPSVTILLAKTLPSRLADITTCITGINDLMTESWRVSMCTATSPVVLVDLFTGCDPMVHLKDDFHPSVEGAKFMADRFYPEVVNAFKGELNNPKAHQTDISRGTMQSPVTPFRAPGSERYVKARFFGAANGRY